MNKTITLFFVFFMCFAPLFLVQGQNLSPETKADLLNEIDVVLNESILAAENLDADKLNMQVDDSRKAGFIINGIFYTDFEDLMANYMSGIQGIANQSIKVINKKITILNENLGIVTVTGENAVFLNSGGSFTTEFAWTFVYEKISNNWKVIQSHQSSTR